MRLVLENSPYSLAGLGGLGAAVVATAPKAPVAAAPSVMATKAPLQMKEMKSYLQAKVLPITMPEIIARSAAMDNPEIVDPKSPLATRQALLQGRTFENTQALKAAEKDVQAKYPAEWAQLVRENAAQSKAGAWVPFAVIGGILTAGIAAAYLLPAGGAAGAATAAGTVATEAAVVPVGAAVTTTVGTAAPSLLSTIGGYGAVAKTGFSYASLALSGVKMAQSAMVKNPSAANTSALQAQLSSAYAGYAQAAQNAGYRPVDVNTFAAWAQGGGQGEAPTAGLLSPGEQAVTPSWLPLLLIGGVGAILILKRR